MRRGANARATKGSRVGAALRAAGPVIVLREEHLMPGARIKAAPAPDGVRFEVPVAPGVTLRGVTVRRPEARLVRGRAPHLRRCAALPTLAA